MTYLLIDKKAASPPVLNSRSRYQTIWLILFGDEDSESESSAQLFEQIIIRSKPSSELSNSRISISIVLT